jgi:hypothetical protein
MTLFPHPLKKLALLTAVAAFAATAHAGILATATYTDSIVSPGVYQYDLTLDNTGTTTIGTFWFSWIPGAGFLTAAPTSIISPTGWSDITTNANKAIQWKTSSDLLAPGDSLSGFEFDSTETPAQMLAPFAGPGLGTGDPETTSFVYIAAPLADPGFQLTAEPAVTSTPEPGTLLLTLSGLGLAVSSLKSRFFSRV